MNLEPGEQVHITSIRIPFGDVVRLVLKVTIASLLIWFVIGAVVGVVWYAIGSSFPSVP